MSVVTADPGWDLVQLNTFVAQMENVLRGPLTKIGNDGTSTTLDIDDPTGKPAKNAVITIGQPPGGAKTIGTDSIFVSGVLSKATAYRPA